MIPYGRQDITQADIDAVTKVLQSDFLTQGPKVPEFEAALAAQVGAQFGVAVNSATSALHIACMALDLGPGDRLWTTPVTFVASANCGRYCGAEVDFVDIDPNTYNLSVSALAAKLETAAQTHTLPKVLVVVHLSGQPCEMQAIRNLTAEYGIAIIEDASHAVGGRYQDEPIGNSRYSDITVFSFHPVKIITSAEGGMALTNDEQLAERMRLARSHGITRDPEQMTQTPDGDWYYQQLSLGYNYRMTELQAALGLSQLQRLQAFVAARHRVAAHYNEQLADLPIRLPWQHPDSYSGYHLYIIRLETDKLTKSHAQVFSELRAKGIGVNLHYIPVHTQPYYQQRGFKPDQFPQAMAYYREAISIPMFASLTESEQQQVIATLREVLT
ncbi:UDP-4-amino-4,6-dideoxy-N-acetyl-beta-L-altrosamine transaminase [Idiomarina sp. MD25a]|uniref:UDP-4-amino-4, 6-dideoxy-N-acetyl-beta-L-altrosamine transaminase n=1 Tax=Idiomarina sp. MD25a TaxID=1889913 RepID=UPI0008F8F0DB|nr:UDP-4-amino-4,6-dideoxy-N-acetyl-beta-L-altrosamine transaminase [Idiomarina sp. MD25a]OIM99542.1 UDP-4-amino-4,6-dideoxy-N-acetyl-beta-L-altrosamine transaminase [Idiomarina sp. MD25a]